jgi:hypothetical protein
VSQLLVPEFEVYTSQAKLMSHLQVRQITGASHTSRNWLIGLFVGLPRFVSSCKGVYRPLPLPPLPLPLHPFHLDSPSSASLFETLETPLSCLHSQPPRIRYRFHPRPEPGGNHPRRT